MIQMVMIVTVIIESAIESRLASSWDDAGVYKHLFEVLSSSLHKEQEREKKSKKDC